MQSDAPMTAALLILRSRIMLLLMALAQRSQSSIVHNVSKEHVVAY